MTQRERSPELDAAIARAGKFRVRVRYQPAEVDGGGDIYDVTQTRFGLRVLIGDVMGAGAPARETGTGVLAAWRAIAPAEPTLAGAAVRLHRIITSSSCPERFVTAFLLNFNDEPWAEFVCCGHPQPLLLRAASVTFVEPCPAAPPLGLLDMADGWCSPGTLRFTETDRLLLYTDGVTEARDAAGGFFPLTDRVRAASLARGADGDALLTDLSAGLAAHLGDSAPDDILMMLVSRDP